MGNGSRLRAIALLVVVLLVGATAGWFANEQSRRARRGKRHGSERLVQRMAGDLKLSAAQQDSVRAILERRRVDIDSLWADVHPRFEAVRSLTNAEIETQLTPEQREKFREGLRKQDARRGTRGRPEKPL
jgi:Spy/CpxP family protein refolding chaperone